MGNASSDLLKSALDILRRAVSGAPYSSQAQLARATGVSEANISRWLNGAATPTLCKLEPVLKTLGVRFALPDEHPLPAPIFGKEGVPALPPAFALKVPDNDRSMYPVLSPGDTVIVDTLQRAPLRCGQIYLVRWPGDGACLFRRLFLEKRGRHTLLILRPDNPASGREALIRLSPLHGEQTDDNIIGLVAKSFMDVAFTFDALHLAASDTTRSASPAEGA